VTFARPWLLLLVLGLVVWWWRRRRAEVPAARYSDVSIPAAVSARRWWVALPPVLRAVSLAALILAAAGPRIGGDTVEVKQQGIAIVITIDISSSMLAEDFAPSNRLAVAQRQAVAFIRGRTADRIGLVAFAGEALTQVPVTLDYPVIEQAVMDLRIGSLEDGTAIGSGLATAVNRLRRAPDKSKVVLLLTDGENNKGLIDPRTAAATAVRTGSGSTPSAWGPSARRRSRPAAGWAASATSCCRCASTSRCCARSPPGPEDGTSARKTARR
jgi:Ca-activated chloride channel homolog